MATIKLVQNGRKVANKRRRRARKNGVSAVAKKANPRKRNGTTKAGASAFAARNGMKLVKRTAANGRKRHHKRRKSRNGVSLIRRQNGLLGNSRETVISVASLLIGLGVTKVESSILTPMASSLLGNLGLGNFAKPLIEAGVAVTVNKWAAEAIKKGSGKFVMYGGLAMALMSVLEEFLPSTSAYNPFASANTSPVVINQPNIVNPNALKAGQAATLAGFRPRVPTGYKRPMFAQSY